jgi:hypothetical protein
MKQKEGRINVMQEDKTELWTQNGKRKFCS